MVDADLHPAIRATIIFSGATFKKYLFVPASGTDPSRCVFLPPPYMPHLSSIYGLGMAYCLKHPQRLMRHRRSVNNRRLFDNFQQSVPSVRISSIFEYFWVGWPNAQGIPVVLHDLPGRNDTVRLGLAALLERRPDLAGCMFLPGDQPLLRTESVEAVVRAFYSTKKRDICRLSYGGRVGSPVLFGRRYFEPLQHLPEGKGGSFLIRQDPDAVQEVPAASLWELADADTPEVLEQLEAQLQDQSS